MHHLALPGVHHTVYKKVIPCVEAAHHPVPHKPHVKPYISSALHTLFHKAWKREKGQWFSFSTRTFRNVWNYWWSWIGEEKWNVCKTDYIVAIVFYIHWNIPPNACCYERLYRFQKFSPKITLLITWKVWKESGEWPSVTFAKFRSRLSVSNFDRPYKSTQQPGLRNDSILMPGNVSSGRHQATKCVAVKIEDSLYVPHHLYLQKKSMFLALVKSKRKWVI